MLVAKEKSSTGFLPLISASRSNVAAPMQNPTKYREPKSPILYSGIHSKLIEVIQLLIVYAELVLYLYVNPRVSPLFSQTSSLDQVYHSGLMLDLHSKSGYLSKNGMLYAKMPHKL